MTRRAGVTLTEVLIAIFVVGIGLMGVLSLFPLGALSMAQSIKDDRCAEANKNASALARRAWLEMLPSIPPGPPYYGLSWPSTTNDADPFIDAMIDPNHLPQNMPIHPFPSATSPRLWEPLTGGPSPSNQFYQPRFPSYPVFIDMVGWNTASLALAPQYQYWVGGRTDSIPRRSLRLAEFSRVSGPTGATPAIYLPYPVSVRTAFMHRYFVQTDDLAWGPDGTLVAGDGATTAANSGTYLTGQVQRDGRYSYSFLLRRPQVNHPHEAELTIVVYSGRSVDTGFDKDGLWIEQAFPSARFYPNTNEAEIDYGTGPRPKIRKNTWVLDATMSYQLPNGQYQPDPHGYFYRVVDVNDDTPGTLRLTLQQKVRAGTVFQNGQGYGVAVVMEHVAEVFERNTLNPTVAPVP